MTAVIKICRSQARRAAAIACVIVTYYLVAPDHASRAERERLAGRYAFEHRILRPPAVEARMVREVHPDYRHISGWISSVGAAVALGDFDGDGIDNDVCLVDPRTPDALVFPAPGTGERYSAVALAPPPGNEPVRTISPMGCLLTDLDEDGTTDALVYYWGRTPTGHLQRGDRVVAFELVPDARWFSNAGIVADVDGDGHLDVVIGNYFPDGSRILDAGASEPATMQDSMSRAYNGGTKRFLLWNGAAADHVSYVDADPHLAHGVLRGWTLALGARDLDGDLLPELYIANDFGPDRLLQNLSSPGSLRFALVEGTREFTTPRSKVLGRDSFKGMGVDFGDIDRDGDDDIAVSNIAAPWALLESNFLFVNEHGRFVDRSEPLGTARSGWAWDVRFADFDDDGWLEIVQANGFVKGTTDRWPELQELATGNDGLLAHPGAWPRFRPGDDLSGHQRNAFYARVGPGAFVDVAAELGFCPDDVSRGLAVADIDADGDLDLAVANQWEDSELLLNRAPDRGASLTLRIELGGSPAIGAAVTVTLPSGERLSQHVDGGSGHSGKSAPVVHFGLGGMADDAPLRVDVRYRGRDGVVREVHHSFPAGTWVVELEESAP